MSDWLLDQPLRIILGLGGPALLGVSGVLLRKSWRQSVRLYQDDLVQCQSREEGHIEIITAMKQRSEVREAAMLDLMAEIQRLREARAYWESHPLAPTTSPPIPSSKP